MMLSQETMNILVAEFAKQPFSVPSPGSGMNILQHSRAMAELAEQIVDREPAAAIELASYARDIHELAGQFAVLQLLPIEMLRHYVEGMKAGK
jgi:hypothetical protein